MAKIYAITNQKGGVGKTTTSINLAASMVAMKRKVLLIDLDPQGNATMGSGVNKHDVELSVYDLLTSSVPLTDIICSSESGIDVIPANSDLTAAEVELLNLDNKEMILANKINEAKGKYDYVFIDCPPSLNMLTVNALCASDGVIIPMQCEYFALEGVADLIQTVENISSVANTKLEIEGVLRTMYDPRNSLTKDVSEQLTGFFGDKLYETVIPRNVRLAEAPSYGMPIIQYDKASKGAMAYLALAGEILRRHKTN
ncbi:ParA family protein [Marinicellulosiphila megalodicopiae]|uniref:ParA family protein n=1 Tax=Marinicellulosiphila megalodicopiae TaxID=2724896 RepID=UPI003BAE7A2A